MTDRRVLVTGSRNCARKAEQAGIPTYRWLRLAEQTLVAR